MSRVPPWFVHHLPQREAAFQAVRKFVHLEGLPVTPLSEEWDGEHLVVVRGTTPDGRDYGIGYGWTDRVARQAVIDTRHCPRCGRRKGQPCVASYGGTPYGPWYVHKARFGKADP